MRDQFDHELADVYQISKSAEYCANQSTRLGKTRELLIANPTPKTSGAYVLVVKNDIKPYWVHLSKKTTVGRDKNNSLVIAHPWISGKHCVIEFDGVDWQINDCNSTNGFKINDRKKTTHYLREGDAVQLGSFLLIFVTGDA